MSLCHNLPIFRVHGFGWHPLFAENSGIFGPHFAWAFITLICRQARMLRCEPKLRSPLPTASQEMRFHLVLQMAFKTYPSARTSAWRRRQTAGAGRCCNKSPSERTQLQSLQAASPCRDCRARGSTSASRKAHHHSCAGQSKNGNRGKHTPIDPWCDSYPG